MIVVVKARNADAATVAAATDVLAGGRSRRGIWRILPFLGPAVVASVAYMDPGNFATTIQGGAEFGYLLLWVVVASNLMAMLIQTLSAKLGSARARTWRKCAGRGFPDRSSSAMWVVMEVVAMATDLAEFLGAALGFYLLFGIPLWSRGCSRRAASFLILGMERYGFRPFEAVITVLVGVIGLAYLLEIGS